MRQVVVVCVCVDGNVMGNASTIATTQKKCVDEMEASKEQIQGESSHSDRQQIVAEELEH